MFKAFWNRSKSRGEVTPAENPEKKTRPAGAFSTDAVLVDPVTQAMRVEAAKDSAIPVKPGSIVAVDADGNQVAQDSAQFNGLKGAFSVGGSSVPDAQFLWYASHSFIGHQMCAVMAQHWLIDKACSQPARDALRNGYEITVNDGQEIDPDTMDKMREFDKRMRVEQSMMDFVRFGRVFGIRIALFLVKSTDPKYYESPFNPDGVTPGSYKGISLIDPNWCAPELDMESAGNPSSRDFYVPTWWRINGKRVHKSHLCIFKTAEVPDILKPSYMYGGIPVPQKIYERVYAAERCANEIPQLLLTKRTNAIHVDLDKIFGDQAGFEEKMLAWTHYRDNYGVKVLGTEESMEQFDTGLTDADVAVFSQYQLVASAANVPVTKLLGTSPKGFNATGEFEERSYHEELEGIQSNDLAPLLERHYLLANLSYYTPELGISINVIPNWNPVNAMSAKEQAEVNKTKADTDKQLFDAGAIDGQDIRARLIADQDSGYSGIDAEAPEPPPEDDYGSFPQ